MSVQLTLLLCCSQVALIVNLGLAEVDSGWRISLGLLCVAGAALSFGMLFLPETPRYTGSLVRMVSLYSRSTCALLFFMIIYTALGTCWNPLEEKLHRRILH